MTPTLATPEDLANRVQWGTPQPALTQEIQACACGPELKAGLFLMNGDLDEAHAAAQSCGSTLGAHWHALMHRHEPDLTNSKYWQRRAGDSAVYPELLQAAEGLGKRAQVAPEGRWDPALFTDHYAQGQAGDWTRELDALEIRALLHWCLKHLG